jgi:hypothetical protein
MENLTYPTYPDDDEVQSSLGQASDLRERSTQWQEQAASADDKFIKNALDGDWQVTADDVPNGEERARLRAIMPDLGKAIFLLEQIMRAKKTTDSSEKIDPERAQTLFQEAQELIENFEDTFDGLGDVRH